MRSRTIALLATLALLVVACGRSSPPPTDTPAPLSSPTAAAAAATATPRPAPTQAETIFVSPVSPIPFTRPGLPLDTGRSQPALAWLDLATEAAQRWSEQAHFLGIEPSFIMERNIPFMPAQAGWFYRFGRPEDVIEFYVQVADGKVTGTTEAEALGQRPKPQPLDLQAVALDSSDARQVYLNSLGASPPGDSELDYALAMDPNLGKPIWWIYNLEVSDQLPVLAVDATNGQVVPME
ncbi:MAG: hypothetical protein HPY83_00705 [Anaerolineae bacterium]|nr:hypothetical protein [Anaerolineae bacterium]